MSSSKSKKTAFKKKPAAKSKALAVQKTEPSRSVQRRSASLAIRDINDPNVILQFSKILKDYIQKNQLSVEISGNQYARVEAWEFCGSSFGLTALPKKPVVKHLPGEYVTTLYHLVEKKDKKGNKYPKQEPFFVGFSRDTLIIQDQRAAHQVSKEMTRPYYSYECECEIKRLSDGVIIGGGYSMCSNMEESKSDFYENAVMSMAQTRSIGKAYRNLLGFVMKSAGYEGTPAEEMTRPTVDTEYEPWEEPKKKNGKQPKQEQPKEKPFPGEDRFKQICEQFLKKKEVTLDILKEHWQFSEDQLKALEIIDKNRKR